MIDAARLQHLRGALERASLHLDNHGIRPLRSGARKAYSIVGLDDLKNRAQVEAAALHNLRAMAVENADPLGKIVVLAGGAHVHEVLEDFDRVFAHVNDGEPLAVTDVGGGRARVEALELMMAAPYPGWYEALSCERQQDWVDANMAFARELFPSEAILSAVLHLDEASPQVHVIAVPLAAKVVKDTEAPEGRRVVWKLDKRPYRGATKAAGLRALQDAYNRHMRERGFELARGEPVEKTKAKRQTADDLRRLRSASDEAIDAAREILAIGESIPAMVDANAAERQKIDARARDLKVREEAWARDIAAEREAAIEAAEREAASIKTAAAATAAQKLADLEASIAVEMERRWSTELDRLLTLAAQQSEAAATKRAERDAKVDAALRVVVAEAERLTEAFAPDGHRYAAPARQALATLKGAAGIVAAPEPETYHERLVRLHSEGRLAPITPTAQDRKETPHDRHAELAKAAKRRQDEAWTRVRMPGSDAG